MEINEVVNEKWDDLLDEGYEPQVENPEVSEPIYGYENEYLDIPGNDDGMQPGGDPEVEDSEPQEPQNTQETDDNILHQFLKDRGVTDPTKIHFENEEGELETLDFDSLDREEQLNVLRELTKPDLTEHETDVINYLRRNRVSFNEVIDHFVQEGINKFLEDNPDKAPVHTYEIDD